MKVVSWLAGGAALVASGGYLLVYVYRWEWHRALLVGVLFLAALVTLSSALVMRRLGRLEQRLGQQPGGGSPGGGPTWGPDPLDRLRAAPVEHRPFPWLRPGTADRSSVFIPFLIGGGVLVSGAAWLVERVAGGSARAGVEEQLAGQLRAIVFPTGPLAPPDAELLAADSCADDPALRLLLGPPAGRPDR